MIGVYKSSQALATNKTAATTSQLATPQAEQTRLSSSLQNLISGSGELNNDWTDRFTVKSLSLGASSFAQLGALQNADEASFQRKNGIHQALVFNSHSTHYAKNALSDNLQYLSEISSSVSGMLDSINTLKNGGFSQASSTDSALAKLQYQFEDNAARTKHFGKATVGAFERFETTIGKEYKFRKEDRPNPVLDASDFTQNLLNKDYSQAEFTAMKQRASQHIPADQTEVTRQADAILNQLFGAEMFKNGELDLSDMGVENSDISSLAKQPEKLSQLAERFEGALQAIQQSIVTQGHQFKALDQAQKFYDKALDQFDAGRTGASSIASLQQKVNSFDLEHKANFNTDFWSDQIELTRDNNLFSWLDKVESELGKGQTPSELDINKGTEKQRNILESLNELIHRQTDNLAQGKTPKDVIDQITGQVFSAGIEYRDGKFSQAKESLIDSTITALA